MSSVESIKLMMINGAKMGKKSDDKSALLFIKLSALSELESNYDFYGFQS